MCRARAQWSVFILYSLRFILSRFFNFSKCSISSIVFLDLFLKHKDRLLKAICRLSKLYTLECCCLGTPGCVCTGWMMRVMERLVNGDADPSEIDMLLDVTKQVEGHTICALGDAAAWPIQGLIKNFRDEIEDRLTSQRSMKNSLVAAQ